MKLSLFVVAVAAVATAACSTQDRSRQGSAAAEVAAAVTFAPTDPEIAHILKTVSTSEIESAKLAKKQSKNAAVRSFANHIIKEHTSMNKKIAALSPALGTANENNAISTSLMGGSAATMSSLKDLKGTDFDLAYVDNQAVVHQQVLDTINKELLPNAKNLELKTLVEGARASVEKHLAQATEIKAKIK